MLKSITTKLSTSKFVKNHGFLYPGLLTGQSNNRTYASKEDSDNQFPTKADPDEYGHFPDPIEHAWGFERKMLIARLAGDDRFEPKVFYGTEHTSPDYPNLVPTHFNERLVSCLCDPESQTVSWYIRKDGKPHRCECGHWFKAVDADPESI